MMRSRGWRCGLHLKSRLGMRWHNGGDGKCCSWNVRRIHVLRAGEALVADPMAEQMPAVAIVAHELAPPSQATSAVANLFAQTMSSGSTNAGPQRLPGARTCPKCQAPTLIRQEGCDSCSSCGYSKCG